MQGTRRTAATTLSPVLAPVPPEATPDAGLVEAAVAESRRPGAPWDDPRAIERNRELMHAPWQACASAGDARAGTASPWQRRLDGLWAFFLAPRPDACPPGFETAGFDSADWARIPVPANWELHGHGEALYCNKAYPFPADPPRAPAENPTGCYRTAFAIPPAWWGRRIFIEFGSVDSAFQFWVNGHEIGWSTDSKLPAAFEITDVVEPGTNQLAVKVCRWGASAYLEKQDYWHLSGIQRSVRLFAKPEVHLRDWSVQTRVDRTSRAASVLVRAWTNRMPGPAGMRENGQVCFPAAEGWRVAMTLVTPDGEDVATAVADIATRSPMYGEADPRLHEEAFSAAAELVVPDALAWTAETPNLYTLLLELRNPDGLAVDWERTSFGIRQIEIVDGVVRINGERLVVRGVNRHEFHPRRGRAVTREDMREDLVAMKRLNFNAVRTCHYPDAEEWYDLCDELGMYVLDEANLETHGIEALTSRDPLWAPAYLERAIRMVLRDRNHPCVIGWSLGNESHWGPSHAAMANWVRACDPTRPVQYENGRPPAFVSDIVAPMYPTFEWIEGFLADTGDKRPLILCEYAYAKGNSTGNVCKYWDRIQAHSRFQGGFVWDWRDKALECDEPTAINGVRWRYGEPRWEQAGVERMCLNGVVGPDLVPHPGAWEIKQQQSPVRAMATAEGLATGQIRVQNRHQFLRLSHLRCCWSVHEEGRLLAEGHCALPDLGPGEEGAVVLPLPTRPAAAGAERFLDVGFVLAAATAWADAGHELCREQFAFPVVPGSRVVRPAGPPPLSVSAVAGGWRLDGAGSSVLVDPACGGISQLMIEGQALLARPLVPTVMRAPTDIDRAEGDFGYAWDWTASGLDRLVWNPGPVAMDRIDSAHARVRVEGALEREGCAACVQVWQEWIIGGDGWMIGDVRMKVTAPVESFPRVGLVCSLHSANRELIWFGRGPHENYPDRGESALVGLHRVHVRNMLTPYVYPQECGLRGDVRRGALTGEAGGILFQGEPFLHCSALPVRTEDLAACPNLADLRLRDETELHLDGFHMGVGGDTGWSRNVHPEYRLPPGRYRFRLRLRPLRAGEELEC